MSQSPQSTSTKPPPQQQPPKPSTSQAPKPKKQLSFLENFALSGLAAVISKTSAAPIERVKLLVQNQKEMIKQGLIDKPYDGLMECITRTNRDQGFLSFWKGNLANCIRYFPTQALNFAFKDKIKQAFHVRKTDTTMTKLGKNILSGGFAGSLSLLFVYSLDFARTRLANDAKSAKKGKGEKQFNGLIDVYVKTLKSDGLNGLYRGFVISCVGIFIYRGFYFGLYDTLQPLLLGEKASVFSNFLLGYSVTVSAGLMSYPIDTIRRRMMMTSGQAEKYSGSIDCTLKILKNEGFMSMMNGAGANILRGIAGAGVLAGFDKLCQVYAGAKIDTSGG